MVSVCMLGLLSVPSAFAVNRDILALQAQVQQMQEMIVSMQQSNDERYAVMHNLLQQTSASVAKVTASVDSLQKAAHDEQSAQGNSLQQLSGQMQSMNDSLDELRARLDKLDKTLAGMQQQQQSLAVGQPVQTDQTGGANPGGAIASGQTAQAVPGAGQPQAAPAPPVPQAPPLDQLYQSAVTDYNAAKYNLASQEFADVIKFYPQSNEAGNSQFYLGEIDYRSGNYKSAINNYSTAITEYPGNSKSHTALLRKAQSELALNQRDAGIRDLRALINRYPQTPEAMQARSKLNGMGVRILEKPTADHHVE
ncbi:MAG: tetratricopeptide repeat protein [Acidobacteriaceae bacterium]